MTDFLNTSLGTWTGIALSVLSGAFAQTMMKLGTRRLGQFTDVTALQYLSRLLLSPLILLAITAYGFGVIIYMFVLSRTDLSFIYPVMTALGLVCATLISATLLREQVSLVRLAGVATMILGVFLVSRSA
jgi:multidrug transporter EmrE-like cation transporter